MILPRHLDNDLGAVMKSGEDFSWERVPFVLEVGLFVQVWVFERMLNVLKKY